MPNITTNHAITYANTIKHIKKQEINTIQAKYSFALYSQNKSTQITELIIWKMNPLGVPAVRLKHGLQTADWV